MAIPPQNPFQFQQVNPATSVSYQEPVMKAAPLSSHNANSNIAATIDPALASNNNNSPGSKKQKTTPPCDRCRQRRIKCDRLEPICSSCIKYKAPCQRTAVPTGHHLSLVSMDAVGPPGLRIMTNAGKRDRHSETEILDSCLRDVQSLQLNRLRRIEQFFDRVGIEENRLEEIGWLSEQIKVQHESTHGTHPDLNYRPEEVVDKLGHRASLSWIKQLLPLLQATKGIQQVPSTAHLYTKSVAQPQADTALQATLTEDGAFTCPAPRPTPFPSRVPLSVLNKTMFELSVYDCTEYLGPVAGTKASSWSEEMRFPLPWLVPEPQVKDSLLVLPPLELMLELIEWMIQSPIYVYFPILTKASIMNALTAAIPGPDAPSLGIEKPLATLSVADSGTLPQRITGRVSAIFLLNAIMALGAAYRSNAIKEKKEHRLLENNNIQELPEHNFQTYFDRSQALTAYILAQPRVSSLQGLLLLMKCPTIPGIQNLYREQACAMALALGLHRDCEPWTLCRSVTQLRRNIFWCCYVIDASYSLNSGSPERFSDDYISIGLPKLPSLELGDDFGELEFEGETNRIGFLLEQAKLWKIVKKIRRCGQTSHNSEDGYREGSNLYRAPENQIPAVPSMTGMSPAPQYGFPSNTSTSPYSPYSSQGTPKTPTSASVPQPAWVWRADSARRILDVELARWQMDLPSHLRFDFALTRKDDPCPHAVRRNGLGAMLQLIFNEVLILLHHPFLALADSQGLSKRDQAIQPLSRNSKSRSSTSSIKSPRSRRSSSTSRSHSASIPNSSSLSDDGIVRPTKPAPPFLNSCTKAAEAITFLIEHLLRTTPEWLACHNEADSAIHIAERVHALNVSLAAKNVSLGTSLATGSASHITSMQAKSQYRRTRAYRKTVADLDKFTMPNDYRPELLTQELIVRGTARDRLVRSMKQMLQHRVGDLYYRLPRSMPELDFQSEGERSEQEQSAASIGTGHDFLDLKLAYKDERVWIRVYNTRIQDHLETKNGSETWHEILHPFSPTPELEVEDEGEEEMDHQHPFGFSMMKEFSLPIYEADEAEDGESNKQRAPRRRFNSRGEETTSEITEDTMDPPQVSTTTFLENFSINTPSNEVCSGMGGDPSIFLDGQQTFAHQKDGSNGGIDPAYDQSYYQGYGSPQVSIENFDPSMVLDGSPHSRVHSSGADQSGRGYYNMSTFLHQDRPPQGQTQYPQEIFQASPNQHQHHHHHHNHPQPLRQQSTHPLQQDPNGSFPNIDLYTSAPMLGFDPSTSSPSSYSAPDSPNQPPPPLENNLGLGLVSVSAPLSLQQQMAMDGGHYLNLVSQQFPNQHIPTQPQGPMGSYQQQQHQQHQQQQQSLDPTLSSAAAGGNPIVRPFYGMPMGGFMTPGLDSLPVINRTTQATSYYEPSSSATNGFSSAVGQALSSPPSGWSLEPGTANAVASYLAKSEPHSPALPPSLVSSVPTSPIPTHQSSFRLMLSPTTESIQGISNRMNAWDGINGPKVVDESDLQGPSLMEYSTSTAYHHQQQTHHHQRQHHHHQHANGSLLEAPAAGGSTSLFGSSWSSASSNSELTTTSTTTGTTTAASNSAAGTSSSSSSSTRMDGIEAGPSSKSSSSSVSVSAVPETPFGDYGESKMSVVVDERCVGAVIEGDKESTVLHGRSFNPLRSASVSGRSH
ncbi:hypothetical protein BGZ95_008445 [Linnemannia exigua]|uniref:Zn(2)-C6 fungal-type domain-containing protein n=1 Tax=Linnemannia exigua TaxID=604196 RepID=A0AAD4DE95_9FUNG|nr:hypothetical protein BGZ95_008445 [Linnemannia exigua]